RPETRMPHYYGLQNNTPNQTSDYQRGDSQLSKEQKEWPDAEIRAMAFYLIKSSESYLRTLKNVQAMSPSDWMHEMDNLAAFRKLDQDRQANSGLTPRANDPALPADMPAADLAKVSPNLRDRFTKDQLKDVLDYFQDLERMRKAA